MARGDPQLFAADDMETMATRDGRQVTMTQRDRQLFAADNMEMLAALDAGSVRLVYLDPPFNSGRSYEALLGVSGLGHRRSGAFVDSWRWNDTTDGQLRAISKGGPRQVAEFLEAIVSTLGRCELAAYLVMIAPRLIEARRVLADDGALFLHCDPSASHYLKVLLDLIFGPDNFRNEVIWKRTHAHSGSRRFGPVHDVILFYSRTAAYNWNQLYTPYSREYIDKYFRNTDERGRYQLITCNAPGARPGTRAHYAWRGVWPPSNRHWAWTEDKMEAYEAEGRIVYSSNGTPRLKRYVDDGEGTRLQDLWLDINPLGAHSAERTGYETQKPAELLERIIEATTQAGDLVVDPFGGSGTTAVAAERLGRSWQIADVSLLASALSLSRVRALGCAAAIALHGFPESTKSALTLRRDDPIAYAVWGTSMLATLLDREDTDPDLASGSGLWPGETGAEAIVSWVPLTDRAVERSARPKRVDRALFLAAGPGSAATLEALTATAVPVTTVELSACVAPAAHQFGSALVAV